MRTQFLFGALSGFAVGVLVTRILLRRWVRAAKAWADSARAFHESAEGHASIALEYKTLADQAEARAREWVTD